MHTDLSSIIANELPVHYSGFLDLESNVEDQQTKHKLPSNKRSEKLKTCETAIQVSSFPRDSDFTTAKNQQSRKDKLASCRSGEPKYRGKSIQNPEDESGMLRELIQRVKALERNHMQVNRKLKGEIVQLNRKVNDAEYRNIMMDVELHLLRNQLNHQAEQVRKWSERRQPVQMDEQKPQPRRKMLRERLQVLSKDSIVAPRGVAPRVHGHQRLRSAGLEQQHPYNRAY